MAVRFIVDSASDILPKQAAELGIIHVPLKVVFGDEEYLDSVNLTHRDFYEKLIESDVLPTTSQATPAAFDRVLRPMVEAGDTAVVITVSSKLSGTCQSACIAAAEYPGKVFVVGSNSVALGAGILAQLGLRLAQ